MSCRPGSKAMAAPVFLCRRPFVWKCEQMTCFEAVAHDKPSVSGRIGRLWPIQVAKYFLKMLQFSTGLRKHPIVKLNNDDSYHRYQYFKEWLQGAREPHLQKATIGATKHRR